MKGLEYRSEDPEYWKLIGVDLPNLISRRLSEDAREAPCVITKKCKIKSIYLGLCISSSDRERIISSVDNSVKVWQMIQETDSYKMNKVRVR